MHRNSHSNIGNITQVIGSTFDAEFDEDQLPAIYNAVKIDSEHKGVKINLTGEVQQHLGGGRVRCVALGSTDGLIRGQDVRRHRRPGDGARRQGDARPRVQPARRADRQPRPGRRRGALADPPRAAAARRPFDQAPSCSRRASRSSTCSRRSSAAARPACSAGPAWARRSFSPS